MSLDSNIWFCDNFSLSTAASFWLYLPVARLPCCLYRALTQCLPAPSPFTRLSWNTIFILGRLSPLTLITGWAPTGFRTDQCWNHWHYFGHEIWIKVVGRRCSICTWTCKLQLKCSSQTIRSGGLPCEKLCWMNKVRIIIFLRKFESGEEFKG